MRRAARFSASALVALGVTACGPEVELTARAPFKYVQQVRPNHAGALHTYQSGVSLLHHDSTAGRFRIWYVTSTVDHVPLADADQSGVPDYVETAARLFEEVYDFEVGTLGFRPPIDDTTVGASDDGGDSRFDVYLVDFGGSADGAFGGDGCLNGGEICGGHMTVENDFAGYGYPNVTYALKVLASHEFFHAIQSAYDSMQPAWWGEATAMWAEERYFPTQSDFEGMLDGYLNDADRSMNVPPVGPVQGFNYGLGIWAEFLHERYGSACIRHIWEALENGTDGVADPEPVGAMKVTLEDRYGSSLAEAFSTFAAWNVYLGPRANPSVSYAEGDQYPIVKRTWAGALPYNSALRVFPFSMQFYEGVVDTRTSISAGVKDDVPMGLMVGLALVHNNVVTTVTWSHTVAMTEPVTLDTHNADRAVVFVVNTLTSGNSLKPTLCIGDPDEVEACRHPGSGGDTPDAGVSADAGTTPPEEKPGVCGCASESPVGGSLLLLALGLVGWRRGGRG